MSVFLKSEYSTLKSLAGLNNFVLSLKSVFNEILSE